MVADRHVTSRIDGRVARLTLDRPARGNAITSRMLRGIVALCGEIEAADVDVVVLEATGSTFSVGFDLDELAAGGTEGARAGADAIAALLELQAVTVAVLRGWVVGGGAALAAACDLRIGDPTVIVRIPEVPLGIPLGWGAMPLLVAELGPSAAKDLVMTGRDMAADEAHHRGFLTRLAAEDGLEALAAGLVGELLSVPSGPLRTTKAQADVAAGVLRTGGPDAELLIEAMNDPGFAGVFAGYLQRVRDSAR